MSMNKTFTANINVSLPKITIREKYLWSALLAAAFLLRIIFACTYRGFEADTACFFSWAHTLWEKGFSGFYSPDYFCDYPPGYLYVLWLLGGLMKLFGMNQLTAGSLLILKLPAILCDLAAGYLICRCCRRTVSIGSDAHKGISSRLALLLGAVYLFHPAVLINSSLWGQIDAVYTLMVILVCILLTEGKSLPAYFLYGLGILCKPQMLMFAPLILCAVAEHAAADKDLHKLVRDLTGGGAAILTMLLLSLPFGPEHVIAQYTDTLSSYPYAAVNACNVWGLFGLNWTSQDNKLGPLTYAQIGTLCILIMTICAFLLFYRLRKRSDRYFLTGAFLVISMFLFSVRMHERYLFPVMLLLLFAFIHNQDKLCLVHYLTLSVAHFGNVYYVLYYYNPSNYNSRSFPLLFFSALTAAGGALFYCWLAYTANGKPLPLSSKSVNRTIASGTDNLTNKPTDKPTDKINSSGTGRLTFTLARKPGTSRERLPLTRMDVIIMALISLFYGIFAFVNLGITKAPVTECSFPYNTYLQLDMEEDRTASSMYWYLLNEQDITCRLEVRSAHSDEWVYLQDLTLDRVFAWESLDLPAGTAGIRLTNASEDANIGEIVFTNESGELLSAVQSDTYWPLFDEAHTFPGETSGQTGSYFDEIYYNRTIYEFMHGLPTYENTHPPFGKILIMVGALLFGTTPFGFRFMGALFGVLMLPFMYLLGRNISRSRFIGGLTAFLFAFDFMHFAQTRLATIDVFIVFFVILMYYFMEQYCHMNFYDMPLRKTFVPLGACGVAFGFGIATKWTGAYAGAGLAILFFMQLWNRYREYRYALAEPTGKTGSLKHQHIISSFPDCAWKTIGFCMIFFVLIPGVIYVLSYIPFMDPSHPGLLERMAANQVNMFHYHSYLSATHPYSSVWYEWPTMIRPIFYYSKNLGDNMRLGISSFGNPLIWWLGIPAFIYTYWQALIRHKQTAVFLCIGYLAQFLPWVLVTRCTFIYHYFPSVPFVVLMISYCFMGLKKKLSNRTFLLCAVSYAFLTFSMFILFYPVLAGTPVSTEYVDRFLRWLDSWVLVLS